MIRFHYYITFTRHVITQHEGIRQVELHKGYTLLEMTREATMQEVDSYNLIYCGVGYKTDQHVQENIQKKLELYSKSMRGVKNYG